MAVFCHSTIKVVMKMPHASVHYVVLRYDCWTPKFVNWDIFSETDDTKVQ